MGISKSSLSLLLMRFQLQLKELYQILPHSRLFSQICSSCQTAKFPIYGCNVLGAFLFLTLSNQISLDKYIDIRTSNF